MDECDCGYCGKCKAQSEWDREIERRSDNRYDRKPEPKDDDEPKHYYWRL